MLVLCALPTLPEETDQARIAFVAPKIRVFFGQDGYCGAMTSYDSENAGGVLVTSGKRTWFRLRSNGCVGDFSFIPKASGRYVVRASTCTVEAFELTKDNGPVRESLNTEEQRLCLLPWNHGVPNESGKPEPNQ
ncbi:MAG: hypothetical protein H6933_02535 [Burkholderiaceae bacterium]|nr:hypothetical protein [Burkholderiaceae bacterium]